MNSQSKALKQRVFSAKSTSLRQTLARPLSGIPHAFSRKDLISNVYTASNQANPSRTASAKDLSNRALLGLEKSKKIVVKQSKRKEELEDQILKLKNTINNLNNQIAQQRGRTESMRKKSEKYTKVLSVEFENESHWNSSTLNSHLIAGIKNTYDALKNKYELLQEEHLLLLKGKNITKEFQYLTYIEVLEKQIKTLSSKLHKYSQNNVPALIGAENQQTSSYLIVGLEADRQRLIQKCRQLQGRYSMCLQTLKDRNRKIQFLEKLIIEKDNNSHAILRESKRLKQQSLVLRDEKQVLEKNIQNQFQALSNQIQQLNGLLISQRVNYQATMSKKLQIKQIQMSQIQKQNHYLQEMTKQLRKTNGELNKNLQELKLKNQDQETISDKKYERSPHPQNYQPIHLLEQQKIDQPANKQIFEGLYLNGRRIPQKADRKYREGAVKKRKITIQQVADISQLIKLKLIFHKFTFSKVKQLFDIDRSTKKSQWEQEYITMRQVNNILKFPPFSLSPSNAQTLSRYLVEDIQEDYVFCDEFNQNNREIIKSILRSLLGQYPICTQNSNLQNQVNKFMHNYSGNLKNALLLMQPSGIISKKRFQQAIRSLHMDCSQEVQLVLLGRMSEASSKISELNYKVLFTI